MYCKKLHRNLRFIFKRGKVKPLKNAWSELHHYITNSYTVVVHVALESSTVAQCPRVMLPSVPVR